MEEDKYLEQFEKQREYVIENQDAIKKRYRRKYIAVFDNKVVDSDNNKLRLAERVLRRFPNDFVLVSNLEDILNPREEYLESPE